MSDTTKKKRRKPEDKAQQIQAVLASMRTGLPMRKSCEAAGVPPSTFVMWVDADPALAEQYAQAREKLIDMMGEQILEISDEPPPMTDKGTLDSAAVAHQRLRIDTRRWLMSKLSPKKYGEKQTIEQTVDMNATIQRIEVAIVDPEV